jgi:ABC-type amino acid transport substrate-binding protein
MESVWTSILRILLSFGFVQAVLVLLAIAMGVGALIWILERRRTAHFSGGARGLASSFWWSTIAMTQAGAAHNAPATLPGRIVATAWMIASVIAITIFTAGLTSSLTRRELQGAVHSINDLRSVRVGAVAKSSTIDYLDRQRIAHQVFADVKEGLTALRAGSVDAFVYDKPLLTWTVRQDFPSTIRVLDITFGSQLYAIALPKGSPMRSMLDIAVLRQIEDEWWQQILFVYLGRNS